MKATLLRRATPTFAAAMLAAWVNIAPAAPPRTVENTFATVVIGDIAGMIDNVGALASKLQPGMNAQMIRSQVGSMIGDPELSAFPKGNGAVLVVPESGSPYVLLEVAKDKQDDISKTIETRSHSTVEKVKDGLLAIGQDKAAADQANTPAGQTAASFLEGDGQPTILATVNVQKVLTHFKPQIESQLAKLPETMAQAETTSGSSDGKEKTAAFILNAYYSLAKRVDVGQLNIDISAAGIQFDKTIYPVGGMTPETAPATKGGDLQKLLPAGDTMRASITMDMTKFTKIVTEVTNEAAAAAKIAPDSVKPVDDFLAKAAEAYDGTSASDASLTADGINEAMVAGVKDEAKASELLDYVAEQATSGGLHNLYKAMGLNGTLKVEKNIRQVDGVSVNRLTVDIKSDNDDANTAKILKTFGHNVYETAIVNKKQVISLGNVKIDDLIAAVKSGSNSNSKPLESAQKLPEGGSTYVDYNVGRAINAVLPAFGMGDAGSALASAPPLLVAGYTNPDNYKFSLRITSEFLLTAKNAAMQVMAKRSAASDDETKPDENKTDENKTDDSKPSDSTPAPDSSSTN